MTSPAPWLAGLIPFDQAISWRPELGMKIYVVRTSDFGVEKVSPVSSPPQYATHPGDVRRFTSEAMHVAPRSEDESQEGWLVSMVYSSTSELLKT